MAAELKIIPVEIDIHVVYGTDAVFDALLEDADGSAPDLTNDEVELTVRDTVRGTVKLTKKAVIVTPQTGTDKGRARFTLDAADLAFSGLDTKEDVTWWRHAIRRKTQSGKEYVYIKGRWPVHPTASDAVS